MSNTKKTGSYYTPKILSDFLVNHIMLKYLTECDFSILEPSCGDGQFLASFFENLDSEKNYTIDIDLLDIDNAELIKAKDHIPECDEIVVGSYCQDYLKFFLERDKTYSLIFGNPPYIKKGNLNMEQIEICEQVHQKAKDYSSEINSNGTIKNIWTAFVEAAIMSLNDYGILCFVIPAEIMQVKYAKELRDSIAQEFDRVEVFAFNELIFEGIQQDVIALIGVKGLSNKYEHGFSFYQVETLEDLKEPKFTEKNNNVHRITLDKWTNYILTDNELNFIDDLKNNYQPIKYYCNKTEVGIVSAANNYFILSDSDVKENGLNRLKSIVKPILPKGYTIPDVASFSLDDLNQLREANKRVNFLQFPNRPKDKLGKIANEYLRKGEDEELHKRYKMTKRKNWYHVPSIWKAEGLFIKRSHMHPKFFVNSSDSLATDSFYRVTTKDVYDIKILVFSFYNSLTFVLSELEGRFYGGGVLELTPNEFKNLSIPYGEEITDYQFEILDQMLRSNVSIEEILNFTNSILLPNVNVERLENIRKKLVLRRLKKEAEIKEEKELKPEVINEKVITSPNTVLQ